MEKVSHIVPASTRQVWVSGEVEKPRRVSEPSPEGRSSALPSEDHEPLSASVSKAGGAGGSTSSQRGGRLNTMA